MVVRRPRHIPIRSCVVCRESSDKRRLLRVVRLPEKAGGVVQFDPTGKLAGRGAYVCADEKCIALAHKQKRFERALSVTQDKMSVDLFDRLRSSKGEDAGGADSISELTSNPVLSNE